LDDSFPYRSEAAKSAHRGQVIVIANLLENTTWFLGCVPLWTASGAGSVARQIMGTTVIGGMTAASMLGIFSVPAIFYMVERISRAAR
jgi:HAE1 family hydrophobic/amphiphilic exporter-1